MTSTLTDELRREASQRGVFVLDGGLSTELEQRGHDISDHLWSARLLKENPAAILDVHRSFFDAGADIATTATYQATFPGMARAGIDHETATALMRLGVQLAREASNEVSGRTTYVAASIGPYGAMLADGSEYRGDYGVGLQVLREFHRPRLQLFASMDVDILAIETIPSALEVEALCYELDSLRFPAWVSLSVSNGRTRTGEPLDLVYAMLGDTSAVEAIGVNCSLPTDAAAAITSAKNASEKPVVAYPNSGEDWDAHRRSWQGARTWAARADELQWLARGATVVGGCCRVGPDQIHELAEWAARRHPRHL